VATLHTEPIIAIFCWKIIKPQARLHPAPQLAGSSSTLSDASLLLEVKILSFSNLATCENEVLTIRKVLCFCKCKVEQHPARVGPRDSAAASFRAFNDVESCCKEFVFH
jgi:hypothetical protein